ncbi:MAG: hypothetical protein ACRD2L_14545, partial [Terriglobia bacterium]
MTRKLFPSDLNDCIERYKAGASTYKIGEALGICPTTVFKHLKRHGQMRTRGEALTNRLLTMPRNELIALCSRAGRAQAGKKRTLKERLARAQSRQKSLSAQGSNEPRIVGMLRVLGLQGIEQMAIDTYNCDFAVGTVAVEILTGYFRFERHRVI